MAFVKQFEFEHLSSTHLERLQRIRDEMERAMELQHQIDNEQPVSIKDYWLVGRREKNMLRDGVDTYEWRSKREYI